MDIIIARGYLPRNHAPHQLDHYGCLWYDHGGSPCNDPDQSCKDWASEENGELQDDITCQRFFDLYFCGEYRRI